MLDVTPARHRAEVKGTAARLALGDGPAGYQLVGGVTAYQGFDG